MAAQSRSTGSKPRSKPLRVLRRFIAVLAAVFVAYIGLCVLLLALYTSFLPPITGVQLQRHIEAAASGERLQRRYQPVSRDEISPHLGRAVIAAEDARFYSHRGIDWQAVQEAVDERQDNGRRRGASTISQQLVKNLFMTTHPSYFRKALEVPLTYAAEAILGKERILELYLNVVEWDDGVFGAEAASQNYFNITAGQLSRYQAAGLAACLPNPRSRSPAQMGGYTNTILTRMSQMGW